MRYVAEIRVGFYGDDFTGSVDVLLQFARRGWAGTLFVGVPDAADLAQAAASFEVVGIAGISRSLPTDAIDAEVEPALTALRDAGADIIQYKACSTADSSPAIGSIGRVIEIARGVFGDTAIPVVFAQPDFARYTLFGHHFAEENGRIHRLDRQPTMSTHPSTPMTESDLRVHLSRQTHLPIGGMNYVDFIDPAQLRDRFSTAAEAAIVLDVSCVGDLDLIGRAVVDLPRPAFVVGSGGMSMAIASTDRRDESQTLPAQTPARGPVLALSGSRSPQTRRQIAAAVAAGWSLHPLPLDRAGIDEAVAEATERLRTGQSVIFSSDEVDTMPANDPLSSLAEASASVIRGASAHAGRIIICGGDTSSRIVTALGIRSLEIAACPEGNVVLLRAHAPAEDLDGAELLLKGGQVGSVDLFEQIRTLGS